MAVRDKAAADKAAAKAAADKAAAAKAHQDADDAQLAAALAASLDVSGPSPPSAAARVEQVAALVSAGCSVDKLGELDDDCVQKSHAELKRRGENAAVRKVNTQHAELVKKRKKAAITAKPQYAQTEAGILKAFRKFDTDHNGKIDRSEFIMIMTRGKGGLTVDQAEMLFDEMDQDHSGFVDEAEFAATWAGVEGQYKPGFVKAPSPGSMGAKAGRIALMLARWQNRATQANEIVRGTMKRLTTGLAPRRGAPTKSSKPPPAPGPGRLKRT